MEIPKLIADLALMLIVAGITTLLFKKIRQPVVLGYIIAGFLISPYFSFLPTIQDFSSIHTWSEIGIIILMFALGLEFNLHKLASVGNTAIITAITEVVSMLAVGFLCGYLLGWSTMDSIFLGGMLSMSSTTIIIKAFDDLKLRGKKFTELVFGSLIVEDIAGIFMMVILSTVAISQNISGGDLTFSLFKMILYLVLWLILGIYLLPTILKKIKGLMNQETLLIVALGTCFGMVMLANFLGFSTALGAFLAGSLLAGTIHAEQIEELTKPIRDLFGAVFFISVGMMVDPKLVIEYAVPILIITLITLIVKSFFSTLGVTLSGQSLRTSVRCGCSLAQIGEFSFIIATLGISLGVMSGFIYPIIVSVSVITTITTPYFIRSSDLIIRLLEKILPNKWIHYLNRHTAEDQTEEEQDSQWRQFIKGFFSSLALHCFIILGIVIIIITWIWPLLQQHLGQGVSAALSLILIYVAISPFIHQSLWRKNQVFLSLWLKRKSNHLPLMALVFLRFACIIILIITPMQVILDLHIWISVVIAIAAVIVFARSDRMIGPYLKMEARFLSNLNERQLVEKKQNSGDHHWLDEQYYVTTILCDREIPDLVHKSLKEWSAPNRLGIRVIKILRHNKHINIPKATETIRVGDELHIIGTLQQLENLEAAHDLKPPKITLHQYINDQDHYAEKDQLLCYALTVDHDCNLIGSSIKDSPIKNQWEGLLLGVERDLLPIFSPNLNFRLQENDLIWILGTQKLTGCLAKAELI